MKDFANSAALIGQTMYNWFVSFNALLVDDSVNARLLLFIIHALTVMVAVELLVMIVLPFIRGLNADRMFLTRHVDLGSMAMIPKDKSLLWYGHGKIGLNGLKGISVFEHKPNVTSYGVPFQGVDIPVDYPPLGSIDWGAVWRDSMPSHFQTLPGPVGGFTVVPIADSNALIAQGKAGSEMSVIPPVVMFEGQQYVRVSGNVYQRNEPAPNPKPEEKPQIVDTTGYTVSTED